MRVTILSALAFGLLFTGTPARAEAPMPPSASPVTRLVQELSTISGKEATSTTRVCCQVSGNFGNLFVQLSEAACLNVPGMPSDDSLCRN